MARMNFPQLLKIWCLCGFVAAASLACSTNIGDECETTAECPTGAVCDITVPGGYCLVRNCERNLCPEDSVCVRFDRDTANCMKYCETQDECRDGHVCRDDIGPANFCYLASNEDPVEVVTTPNMESADVGGSDAE